MDSNGKVTAHKAGTAAITAKVGDKTATCTVTVKKSSFEDAEISLSNDSFTYDGKEKKPSVTVKIGGKEISDYSVSYSNNINAGTAKVTVTATGDYHGTRNSPLPSTKQICRMQVSPVFLTKLSMEKDRHRMYLLR